MKRLTVLIATLALVGCTGAERDTEDTRVAAGQLIGSVVAKEYVGVSIDPIVTCTVDNASDEELETLVTLALGEGMTGRVNQQIISLTRRSSTQACIRGAGVVLPR